MARGESQGLTIALIISVMLNFALGATSFMFMKQYQKELARAVAAEDNATKEQTAARNTIEDNNELKRCIGQATTAKMDTITADFKADMETYAVGYSEETRDYRKMLAWLFDVNQKQSESLASEQAARAKLEQDHVAAKLSIQQVADKEKQRADNADIQLSQEQKNYQDSLQASRTVVKTEVDKLADEQKTRDATVDDLKGKLTVVETENRKLSDLLTTANITIKEVLSPDRELADGKIRWVNQASRAVWIDLGRADALRRLMSFGVYAADTSDVTKVGKKASIEVTKILGEHLAEARIVEDVVTDPIMPGEMIYSPLWSPGEKEHFALTSGLDIDDDGRSDLPQVIDIITMNGGVVDCYLDDAQEDAPRVGDLTKDTRFLVQGMEPEGEEHLKNWTQLLKDAKQRGLVKISLKDLLNRMGWKNQSRVIRLGEGASPADFRAKPPEGVPRVSGGNVTDLFKKRRPPGGGRGSAY